MSSHTSLVYVSAATDHFSDSQLLDLLKYAREKNKSIDVTGLLLYNSKGTFLQLLEGPEDSIEMVYKSITSDSRHTRINCLTRRRSNERIFPDWTMGFKHLSPKNCTSIPGVSAFFHDTSYQAIANTDNQTINDIFTHFKSETARVNTG